jgi:hypothetical protein
MDAFRQRFAPLLVFTCPCFDRIAVNGYLSMLSRPEHIVYCFRQVRGIAPITKEALKARTTDRELSGWHGC